MTPAEEPKVEVKMLISADGEVVFAEREVLKQSAVLDGESNKLTLEAFYLTAFVAFADAALPGQLIPVASVSGEILQKACVIMSPPPPQGIDFSFVMVYRLLNFARIIALDLPIFQTTINQILTSRPGTRSLYGP
jgi:hypothetical protein